MTLGLYDTIKNMQPGPGRDAALKRLQNHGADYKWHYQRRPDQTPPADKLWDTWIYSGGRGAGKTRTGTEEADAYARSHPDARLLVVARTAADVRETLVEGESGFLALPGRVVPTWEPSLRRLTWYNGARAFVTSADEPDSIRGVEAEFVLADEVASWRRGRKLHRRGKPARTDDAWDTIQYVSSSTGGRPRIIVTTTPKSSKVLKKIHRQIQEDPLAIRLTQVPTNNNALNLSPAYLEAINGLYSASTVAKTELQGQWPWPL